MKIIDELIFGRPNLQEQAGLALDLLRSRFGDVLRTCWIPFAMMGLSLGAYVNICIPFMVESSYSDLASQTRETVLYVGGGLILLILILISATAYCGGMIGRILTTTAIGEPEPLAVSVREVNQRLRDLCLVATRLVLPPALYVAIALLLTFGPGTIIGESDVLGAFTAVGLIMLISGIAIVPMLLFRPSLGLTIRSMEDVRAATAVKVSLVFTKVNRLTVHSAAGLLLLTLIITSGTTGLIFSVVDLVISHEVDPPIWISLFVGVLYTLPTILGIAVVMSYCFAAATISYLDAAILLRGYDIDVLQRRAESYGKRSRFRA